MKRHWTSNPIPLAFLMVSLVLLLALACGTSAPAAPESPQKEAAPASASGGSGASQTSATAPTATPSPAQAQQPSNVENPEGVLRIANKDLGPPQFIPVNMAVPQATYVSPVIFDPLWKMSPDAELQNHLLEDWSQSDDGTTWTLKFKKGIPFHKDWGEVRAQDFVEAVEQIIRKDSIHPGQTNLRRIFQQPDGSINIVDDGSVCFGEFGLSVLT